MRHKLVLLSVQLGLSHRQNLVDPFKTTLREHPELADVMRYGVVIQPFSLPLFNCSYNQNKRHHNAQTRHTE